MLFRSPESEAELAAAYHFLRRLEHRLQYVNDAQTHMLPAGEDERAQIAVSMDFPDWPALLEVLDGHRRCVGKHFEEIFAEPEEGEHPLAGIWAGQSERDDALEKLSAIGYRQPQALLDRLQSFRDSARYVQLPASNRERLDTLGPRLIDAAAATAQPDATWQRGLDFLETISRRGAYLALLQQYPQALRKVAELIGASSWAAEYLTRHPILLDELLDPRLYDESREWDEFRNEVETRLAAHVGDTEREMDVLREAHHAQVFRLLARDIAGQLSVEHLSDNLAQLADIVVEKALELCWEKLKNRHPKPEEKPKFAVIGYGKLGGKELGYASDLDLVYLHDDPEQGAGELYARLAQRMNSWMSSQTSAGILFETDLRLRPNGDAGMLVPSVESFREYQLKNAWVWEHQALTRARFCAGDPAVGARFEAIRREILCQPRDMAKLREEVLAMRKRMLDSHASNSDTEFDIKQDPGGIIDVEFIVQYLVLGHAHAHPELASNLGNIALLRITAGLGLIPQELAEPVREAYRIYRRLQHAKRLNGSPKARAERAAVSQHIDAVRALWHAVLDTPASKG